MDGRWFDVYAFRPAGADSRKVALLFSNITERKRAERQLQAQALSLAEQDRRKDEFMAMLGRELRNPLAPIFDALQLLRLQADEAPVQRRARTVIERQVGEINLLVDQLLEISRITTGRIHLLQERVELGAIMERAAETAQPLIAQCSHEMSVTLPPEPLWLHADASRLEQVT